MLALMVSVVWRLVRSTSVAAGLIETSTIDSSGTVRPSGERTMKVAMSAMPTSPPSWRSEEHTSELQSLMRISYAVFCLKKKKTKHNNTKTADTTTIKKGQYE